VNPDLFVYGTLVPGGRYWSEVADAVVSNRPAQVRGRLYDTGRGYPAAIFHAAGTEVGGYVLTLWDPETTLAHLDSFEGHEYVRKEVETVAGERVWSYEWQADLAPLRLLDGGIWH
jgi:gamma-glutamylcyclotransferase (GGCT)/AIG2-like uncharacterized protein YtfP